MDAWVNGLLMTSAAFLLILVVTGLIMLLAVALVAASTRALYAKQTQPRQTQKRLQQITREAQRSIDQISEEFLRNVTDLYGPRQRRY